MSDELQKVEIQRAYGRGYRAGRTSMESPRLRYVQQALTPHEILTQALAILEAQRDGLAQTIEAIRLVVGVVGSEPTCACGHPPSVHVAVEADGGTVDRYCSMPSCDMECGSVEERSSTRNGADGDLGTDVSRNGSDGIERGPHHP